MVRLYHYTNTEGKIAIETSGIIKKSQRSKHRDDAMYGTGVYLTSLGPENSTSVIVGNNYDGNVIPYDMKRNTEWYFAFDTSEADLQDVEQVGTKRDVWLLRGRDLTVTRYAAKRNV